MVADAGLEWSSTPDRLSSTLGEALLVPTRIYADAVAATLAAVPVHALCHVTGGGLPGNLPRVLPEGLGAVVSRWEEPPIFDVLRDAASIDESEMRRTFNLGVGLVIAVAEGDADASLAALADVGEKAFVIGSVERSDAVGEARVRYA